MELSEDGAARAAWEEVAEHFERSRLSSPIRQALHQRAILNEPKRRPSVARRSPEGTSPREANVRFPPIADIRSAAVVSALPQAVRGFARNLAHHLLRVLAAKREAAFGAVALAGKAAPGCHWTTCR